MSDRVTRRLLEGWFSRTGPVAKRFWAARISLCMLELLNRRPLNSACPRVF